MTAFHYKDNKVRELYGQFFDRNKTYTLIVNNLGLNKSIAEKDLFRIFGNFYRVTEIKKPNMEKIELSLEKLSRGVR